MLRSSYHSFIDFYVLYKAFWMYCITGSEDFFSTTHSVNVTLFERALRTAIPSIKEVHILNAYDEALPVPTCWRTGPHLQHEHSSAPDCGSPSLLIPPAVTLLSNPLRDSPNNSVVVAATVVVFAVSDGNRNRNRNAAAAPLYGVMRRPELHTRLLANLAAFRGAFASANMSGQSVVFPVDQCALEQSSGPRGPASDRYTELDLSPLWTSPWYRRPEQHVGPMLDLRLRCALGCRQRVFNADGRCRYDTCSGRGKCSEERGIGGIKRAVCTDCSPASGARCQATKRHLDGSQYGLFEPLQRCGESGEEVTAVSLETMTASASLGGAQLLFYAGPLSTESSEAAAPSSLANTSVMVALLLVPEIISQSYKPVLAVGPVSDPAVLFFRELEGSRLLDPAWHRIEVEVRLFKNYQEFLE